jgi:hypothetical protein
LLGSVEEPPSAIARLVKERDQLSQQAKALQMQLNSSELKAKNFEQSLNE